MSSLNPVSMDGKVSCLKCPYKSKQPSHVRAHMKNVHGVANPKINKCQKCGKMFQNANILKSHIASSCKKILEDANDVTIQVEKTRKPEIKSEVYYDCSECSFRTENKYVFRQHTKTEHRKQIEGYKCDICKESFKIGAELKAHTIICKQDNIQNASYRKKKSLQPVEDIPIQEKLVSENNKRKLESQKEMTTSIKHSAKTARAEINKSLSISIKKSIANLQKKRTEAGVKLINCLECIYKSKYPSHIRSHMRRVHGVANPKINKCEFCAQMFQNAFMLRSHMKTLCTKARKAFSKGIAPDQSIEKNKPQKTIVPVMKRPPRVNKIPVRLYDCPKCDTVCKTFLEFRIHKKTAHVTGTNSEVEIYKCVECDYESMYTCSVRAHMKIVHKVSNPKIHGCSYCGEMFRNLFQLKSHRNENSCVNTNKDFQRKSIEAERKRLYYNCSKCNYRTRYPQCIRSHMAAKHQMNDPDFFKCKPCREIFVEMVQLKKHKCGEHKIERPPKERELVLQKHVKAATNAKSSTVKFKVKVKANSKSVPSRPVYSCDACEAIFENPSCVATHKTLSSACRQVIEANRDQIFATSILLPDIKCEQFDTSQDFINLTEDHTPLDIIEECDSMATDSEDMSPIKEQYNSNSTYCYRCGSRFPSRAELDRHVIREHVRQQTEGFKEESFQSWIIQQVNHELAESSVIPGIRGDLALQTTNGGEATEYSMPEDQSSADEAAIKSFESPVPPEDLQSLQLGDPSSITDGVPQVLQYAPIAPGSENLNGFMDHLDLSSFPPDTVFYTYEDEADLFEGENQDQETVFYTFEYLDDPYLTTTENDVLPDDLNSQPQETGVPASDNPDNPDNNTSTMTEGNEPECIHGNTLVFSDKAVDE